MASPPHREVVSSSTPPATSDLVQEFIARGCRLYSIERSIRGKVSFWVILQILYQTKVKEHGCEAFVCLLRYLLNAVLNNVKLVALGVCLGMIKRHVKEDDSEEGGEIQETRTFEEITENVEVKEEKAEEEKEEEESGEIQELAQHVTIDVQETPTFEEITENVEVKEEKAEEEKDLLRVKRRSDWWVNTRNIMAMVAIFLATVSITLSFSPPAKVLDVKVATILFNVAINICFLVSSIVLFFFLFGVTSTSPSTEQRILQLANLGLWISFVSITAAYLVNMWVSIRYIELNICLTISTCVVFGLLASFLFSAKFRAIFGGVKILKETDDDEKPYILYEIFKLPEAHVVVQV